MLASRISLFDGGIPMNFQLKENPVFEINGVLDELCACLFDRFEGQGFVAAEEDRQTAVGDFKALGIG